MSVYSTLDITREDGLKLLLKGIMDISDQELEDLLLAMYGSKILHNFRVVIDYEGSERPYQGFFF